MPPLSFDAVPARSPHAGDIGKTLHNLKITQVEKQIEQQFQRSISASLEELAASNVVGLGSKDAPQRSCRRCLSVFP